MKNMNPFFFVGTVIAAVFVLASCGGGESATSSGPVATSGAVTPPASQPMPSSSPVATPAPSPPAASPAPPAATPSLPPNGSPPMPPPTNPLPPVTTGTRWSDPLTWGGTLPTAGSAVVIPAGKTVVLDMQTPALKGLTIEGALVAADADIGITADFVFVKGGRLQIGSSAAPYLRQATITLTGSTTAEQPATPGFGSKVLAVADGILELHGAPVAQSWTRLAANAAVGAKQITLAQAPGWKAGDQIVIATSSVNMDEYDVAEIAAINGTTIILKAALRYRHLGGVVTPADGIRINPSAEVGLLNRNIVVQGDANSINSKIGGHAMFMAMNKPSTIQISGAEFRAMGQLNQPGRYPVHFHIMGNACGGCYVKNSSVRDTVQRGIVVHDSAVTVESNVIFNTVGHNVVVETATTEGAVINGNLALVNKKPAPDHTDPVLVLQNDRVPANFWIKSARNTITNNSAAGAFSSGFIYDGVNNGPALFRGNVAHAAMNLGGDAFPSGSGVTLLMDRQGMAGDVFADFFTYHNENGFWPEQTGLGTEANQLRTGLEPLVSSGVVSYDDAIAIFSRGPGNRVRHESPLVIGGPLVSNGEAFRNQYGSDQVINNPTLVNYRGILNGGHDTHPSVSQVRFSNVRLINSTIAQTPDDMTWSTYTDDTLMPRGTYVSPMQPYHTTPECVRQDFTNAASGDSGWFYRCPRMYGYAEVDLRSLAQPSTPLHTSTELLRSDGLRIKSYGYQGSEIKWVGGMNGFAVLHDAGLTYTVTSASASGYALRLPDHPDFYDVDVRSERVSVEVAVPMNAAPTRVARGDQPGVGTSSLRAATTRAQLASDPLNLYYYDAAARQVIVRVSSRWVSVIP